MDRLVLQGRQRGPVGVEEAVVQAADDLDGVIGLPAEDDVIVQKVREQRALVVAQGPLPVLLEHHQAVAGGLSPPSFAAVVQVFIDRLIEDLAGEVDEAVAGACVHEDAVAVGVLRVFRVPFYRDDGRAVEELPDIVPGRGDDHGPGVVNVAPLAVDAQRREGAALPPALEGRAVSEIVQVFVQHVALAVQQHPVGVIVDEGVAFVVRAGIEAGQVPAVVFVVVFVIGVAVQERGPVGHVVRQSGRRQEQRQHQQQHKPSLHHHIFPLGTFDGSTV